MSGKEFNWDEFNKVLQGSSNICAGARKDIENAIKAGRGVKDEPNVGEIYQSKEFGDLYIVAQLSAAKYRLINLHWGTRWADDSLFGTRADGFERKARSLSEYLAAGGKI